MKYAAAMILIALVACTSQPVTKIGIGGVWNTQDHQAAGGNSGGRGASGCGCAVGGRGAASGGMGRGRT